ncbi:MAG: hypothetical protein COA50_08120 [Flavobacteriaceae bacterium]|nr:MAG: hypothetical protein COA50_08120 [Flavobacteriaceae bacterium]
MKITITLVFTFLFINFSLAQQENEILEEANLLYNSEKASWHGTDIFLEQFPSKKNQIGGYISMSTNKTRSCLFFDQNEEPNLLAKITFNKEFDLDKVEIDTLKRKLNKKEMDLFYIKNRALIEINRDTLFKLFENTNFNIVPIITKKSKKVYILTGSKLSGVVVLGNDYLITFDKNNIVKTMKPLHKNILTFEYNEKTEDAVSMHSHVHSTGNLITPTDLCTLMLYGDYVNWKQHVVLSKKNVSLWDFDKKKLLILTRKAWDKIYGTDK